MLLRIDNLWNSEDIMWSIDTEKKCVRLEFLMAMNIKLVLMYKMLCRCLNPYPANVENRVSS